MIVVSFYLQTKKDTFEFVASFSTIMSFLLEIGRTHRKMLLKYAGKIVTVVKTTSLGNLRHGQVPLQQQATSFLQTHLCDILQRTATKSLSKKTRKLLFTQIKLTS